MSIYAVRVTKGAALLDQHNPGWDQRIDLENLNQSSAACCVVGQTCGGYYSGTAEMGLDYSERAEHGFTLDDDARQEEWHWLTEAWRSLILSRRNVVGETTGLRHNDVLAAMFRDFESSGVVIPSTAVLRILRDLGVVVTD